MADKLSKVFLTTMIVALSGSALAVERTAAFPQRPIRLIVPYTAGSGNDISTRGIAPYVEKNLGVRIIIENKPGASGRIAVNDAWKAKPDGYTLVHAGFPSPVIAERLFPVNFRSREFTHIFAWSADNSVLVVNSETWNNAEEFIAAARSKNMSGGHAGIGGPGQLAGIALEDVAKFKPVNWVPFSGGSEIMMQLVGRHIHFGITSVSSARALADADKLRPLIVFSKERDPTFPNAPLPRELGLNLTVMPTIRGVVAPPGLPLRIADILESAFAKAVQEPEYIKWAKVARIPIESIHRDQFLASTIDTEKNVAKYLDKIKSAK